MPAVAAPATVLITGATGFIASQIVKGYIDAGFTVIGTVRRASGGEYLKSLFPERFSYVVIEDIQSPGALDELAQQADAIAHTASPVVAGPEGDYDPYLLIGPAVEGTRNVLTSAAVPGSRVQRVVITGSIASLGEPHDGFYEYSDKDWNNHAISEVERLGAKASPRIKYLASKTLAERASLEFIAQNKPKYDVVTILPAYVYGPSIDDFKSVSGLKGSRGTMWNFLTTADLDGELPASSFVDVRDVARAHVDATTRQELAGARLILAHELPLAIQDFRDAYYAIPEAERPSTAPYVVPRGILGAGDKHRASFQTFSRDSQNRLGWELRGLADSVRDFLHSANAKGLLGEKH